MTEIIPLNEPMEFDGGELTEVRFDCWGSEDICQSAFVIGGDEAAGVLAIMSEMYSVLDDHEIHTDAELADLLKDRERLEWLIDNYEYEFLPSGDNKYGWNKKDWGMGPFQCFKDEFETPREAIDAAMEESK